MKTIAILFLCLYIVVAHPTSLQEAAKCDSDECSSSDCRCSSKNSPLGDEEAPQLIALTFDEAVVDNIFTSVWEPLLFDRTNPDGNPISGTFFVAHEYTDYRRVQDLYLRGFEIGVNSVTKNSLADYWRNASVDTLTQEFQGQRTIISHFGNIPVDDLIGARTPQLQLEGDVTIEAYEASGVQYDCSWTSRSNSLLFPYTLDYLSTQECRTGTECPSESHPGFWVAPIIDLIGDGNIECNSLITCNIEGSADDISTWLLGEVERISGSNKAPLVLMVSSAYFRYVDNSLEGFTKFLDSLGSDVYLVSVKQIIDWMKNPVPLSQFSTEVTEREAECNPTNCLLTNNDGNDRYMMSCVECPEIYPWIGNPLGLLNPDDTTTTTTTESTTPPTDTEPPTTTELPTTTEEDESIFY